MRSLVGYKGLSDDEASPWVKPLSCVKAVSPFTCGSRLFLGPVREVRSKNPLQLCHDDG